MTQVTAQMSVSLDGFYTGPVDPRDPKDMAGWMKGPEAPGFFRVTRWVVDAMGWRERQGFAGGERSVNSDIMEETFAAAGAYVMGRRMFDAGEVPWGNNPPFRAPVLVVTHRPREVLVREGGTSFTFVTEGVEKAIELARAAAGDKDAAVAGGGTLLRQVIAAGLLDQLEVHIAPVLLGDGQRLFDASLGLADNEGIELTPTRVIETPEVTHVRYAVGGRTTLHLDDRGSGGGPARQHEGPDADRGAPS
jgi:dihydrofolate reductase